jgi:hypothetical protein
MDRTSRRPTRRRHAAAGSRVAAGLLSAAMFLGLGGGMALRHAATATSGTTSTSSSGSGGSASDTSSGSSWSATPGSSSSQSPATSSQGS